MGGLMRTAILATIFFALPALATAPGPSLEGTAAHRSLTLLGDATLEASCRPSLAPPLRLLDGLRFDRAGLAPLDTGGGVDSEVRQILALILGFIPGFGLGHLIARDRDGFILFLVIDLAIYVAWGWVGWGFWEPFRFLGGVVWLVVHIFQALDAHASAGGARLIQLNRERATRIAVAPGREEPALTTRAFQLGF